MSDASSRQQTPDIQPVIAELLRTCVHPPVLSLLIDHIIRKNANDDSGSETDGRQKRVTKLFLTDGQLVIQALLHRRLSTLPEIEDLDIGDVVEIHDFVVKKAERKNRHGHVVYLGIENCYVVKNTTRKRTNGLSVDLDLSASPRGLKRNNTDETDQYDDDMAGGFLREDSPELGARSRRVNRSGNHPLMGVGSGIAADEHPSKDDSDETDKQHRTYGNSFPRPGNAPHRERSRSSTTRRPTDKPTKSLTTSTSGSEDEGFETARVDIGTAQKRRRVLHELNPNVVHHRSLTTESITTDERRKSPSPTSRSDRRAENAEQLSHKNIRSLADAESDARSTKQNRRVLFRENADLETETARSLSRQPSSSHLLSLLADLGTDTQSQPSTPVSQLSITGPVHQLASLYSPSLPSKSYVVTALVVPTYSSSHLISRPNSPFPPKRHIKVVDTSLAAKLDVVGASLIGKGVTVSVYRDAVNFKPVVGRVALLRGVVMQRLNNGEIILNVYPERSRIQRQSQRSHTQIDGQRPPSRQAVDSISTTLSGVRRAVARELSDEVSLMDRGVSSDVSNRTAWFIDDHDILREEGFNVDGLQRWWDEQISVV